KAAAAAAEAAPAPAPRPPRPLPPSRCWLKEMRAVACPSDPSLMPARGLSVRQFKPKTTCRASLQEEYRATSLHQGRACLARRSCAAAKAGPGHPARACTVRRSLGEGGSTRGKDFIRRLRIAV